MARSRNSMWTAIISVLVGVVGASIFWVYVPYGHERLAPQGAGDLQNGRVWRYFHNTKEAGFSKEDEGFLPMALYYGGQKHYAASEIEPPPGAPGSPPQTAPAGKQPQ